MKLVNFHSQTGIKAGLLTPEGVVDLAAAELWHGPLPISRIDIETLSSRIGMADRAALPLLSVNLAPIVISPEKIICIGLNYRRHALEANMTIPSVPVIFAKYANSLTASGTHVALPDIDSKYDYEAELGVVVGREARDVAPEDALDYVAGYCCANDLSGRNAQLATSQWTLGKMFDGFLPLGPFLATADEIPDPQALRIQCRVNGEVRQDSSTSDMIFSVAEIIAFISRHATLKPGDVIVTGTPEGVQLGSKSSQWLKPRDKVTIEIDGLGILTNCLTSYETHR